MTLLTACDPAKFEITTDATCNVKKVKVSDRLKAYFRGEVKRAPQPDYNNFLRDVAANNEVIEKQC